MEAERGKGNRSENEWKFRRLWDVTVRYFRSEVFLSDNKV